MNKLLMILLSCACFSNAFAQDESVLKRYVAYNLWANQQMAEWLKEASPESWEQEIESSFTSLKKTALHIWSAEFLWLKVLQDSTYEDNPTKDFTGTFEELIAQWLAASEAFHLYVAQLSEEQFDAQRGSNSPLFVSDIIQHCMNHSTYHRGQLITMGRQAGLGTPPRTDFIFYVRQ
jgi:uncharacterized damage-inducible protein DinB